MVTTRSVVQSDPEIMSETPVFVGTRVPVDALFDSLAANDGLEAFLDDFPSVTREQVVDTIEAARRAILRELMRILFDESLPRRIAREVGRFGHETRTV